MGDSFYVMAESRPKLDSAGKIVELFYLKSNLRAYRQNPLQEILPQQNRKIKRP